MNSGVLSQQNMEVCVVDPTLVSLLRKANKTYRRKQYLESLEIYCQCLGMMPKDQECRTPTIEDLELAIYSLRGMNYVAIREYQKAESDFNFVLKRRSYDATTIVRRASMNIKRQHYRKVVNDLTRLIEVEPESVRVAALILEVKDKISKLPEQDEKQELSRILSQMNNLNTDDLDEEEMLNFCNLKIIDRKSLHLESKRSRNSQVSFKEDTEEEYEAADWSEPAPKPRFSVDDIKSILNSQKMDQDESENYKDSPTISVISKPNHKKSILKSSLFQNRSQQQSIITVQSQAYPLRADEIKDIEGKSIRNSFSKVKFRKSQILQSKFAHPSIIEKSKKPGRKSCLKQSAFGLQKTKSALVENTCNTTDSHRTSQTSNRSSMTQSFINLKFDLADGRIHKSEILHEGKENGVRQIESEKSFDSGDQYNIFGDNSAQISEKLKKTLKGLSEEEQIQAKDDMSSSKLSLQKKKSILKISSFTKKDSSISNASSDISQPALKKKKSVLFK